MLDSNSGAVSASSTAAEKKQVIYLADYRPSNYLIESTSLVFDLYDEKTIVSNTMVMQRNAAADDFSSLSLHGENLRLMSLSIDGVELEQGAYTLTDRGLTIQSPKQRFVLTIKTEIDPKANLSFEGLYLSDGMYCTQCEAEGFRKITYYLDRPDVMSIFDVEIIASKQRYPVLLSNGNNMGSGDLDEGRHWVKWQDPHKKPCYLFALVAGDLQVVEDDFRTMSGRDVKLQIFVEAKDLDKCDHAMRSLKNAMVWDEQVYGREYDLDLYMIVAVDFFNMGAMENKGLNIFNTSCVLAHPKTQTDWSFQRVEAVIAHEYFHNWSGNRVTCRDWFQLSLKEGLTVFRDASFSADMNSATVKRIEDVNLLRTSQFAEDSGPMAHPIRPESFIEISNFYTLTIYEKGAEVIRMIHKLLGAEKYRAGTDLYFSRHDGEAVTCEDFVKAMEDASGVDLSQFRRWYSQAGTPVLTVKDEWDEASSTYHLIIEQSCPPTPESAEKLPFYMPIDIALLDKNGLIAGSEQVLHLSDSAQRWSFDGMKERPTPSLLRGFSAPVKLRFDYTFDQLLGLMQNEVDGFTRWDASRRFWLQLFDQQLASEQSESKLDRELSSYVEVIRAMLDEVVEFCHSGGAAGHCPIDIAMLAEIVRVPDYQYISEQYAVIDVEIIVATRRRLFSRYITMLLDSFETVYLALSKSLASIGGYSADANSIAMRSLKNTCLNLLMYQANEQRAVLAQQQYQHSDNMTDQFSALAALVGSKTLASSRATSEMLEQFITQWRNESLVVNQWFSVQATSMEMGALDHIRALAEHDLFDKTNPNKVRSLLGAFAMRNFENFHRRDGGGYDYLADQVIQLDSQNPQLASRLLTPLTHWKRYDVHASAQMKRALARIHAVEGLSADVFEVVEKSLA